LRGALRSSQDKLRDEAISNKPGRDCLAVNCTAPAKYAGLLIT
jgi:hypothetical protein